MPKVVQEKFQVTYPDYDSKNEEDVQGWCTDMEARAKKYIPGREGVPGGDYDSRYINNAVFWNALPPGMDIEDQELADIRQMGINISGNFPTPLAQGDVTNGELHPMSLRKGFDRKKLLQTDDVYTREHNDAFYDDVGGFCERNNYLDRS
jgi:hypothetical protein